METILNYESGNNIQGYLEIVKLYKDGTEEVHFSDQNVITSGLGYTLLKAFSTTGAGSIAPFQIVYFQLGTGGSDPIQVSSTGNLVSSLIEAQYGTANFEISTHDLSSAQPPSEDEAFGIIPFPYIKKISPTRVMYQIFIGENACNDYELDEVGLFSRNPNSSATEGSYLCAYRWFTALDKKEDFSVLFRWTIEF